MKFEAGDRIKIAGGKLWIGRLLMPGERGTIIGRKDSEVNAYAVEMDSGGIFDIAPENMEKVDA